MPRTSTRLVVTLAALAALALAPACSKGDADSRGKGGGKGGAGGGDRLSEAELNLHRIEKGLKAAFRAERALPVATAGPTPATPCCESGRPDHKCAPDPALWAQPPWRDLGFAVDEPHYFQYAYESDGKTATVRAIGDLDCDQVTVTYELRAQGGGDALAFDLVRPATPD